MKTLRNALVLSILSLVGFAGFAPRAAADVVEISPYSYAAVAFSPSTGEFGYAWNHGSRSEAERVALSRCTEKDAKIIGWVNDGFMAVAIGEDNSYGMGYRFGDGANTRDAVNTAVRNLSKHTEKEYKTLIVLCSGNVRPQVIKR
jgi:serine/threonine-protein kinase